MSIISTPLAASSPDESIGSHTESRIIISSGGVQYEITYNGKHRILVSGINRRSHEVYSGFAIDVDDQTLSDKMVNFSSGEHKEWSYDINRGINVVQDNHTIRFSTFGNSTAYNFTRDIETADAEKYPTPYISNVSVENGTIDGEPSAVANVTVVNPGPQTYGMKLLVNTEGTDGSFYAVSIPSYTNQTFSAELLEPRGDRIAGEARLYVKRPRKEDGALDQVEFVGSARSGTKQWNSSYEPVRGPWLDDSYEYENESIHTDADDRENLNPFDDPGRRKYVNAVVLTIVGVVAALVWRKLNRPT
ncbi:hypothetical protein ACFQE1_05865 [Halobium palmae]|uniref:Uncharacterized protein n=1 Tax=Halobium palmae TaxID=1776492 RepID=A0ABD5RX51_9EURY